MYKLKRTVDHLQFVACAFDEVKQNEELQDRPPQ